MKKVTYVELIGCANHPTVRGSLLSRQDRSDGRIDVTIGQYPEDTDGHTYTVFPEDIVILCTIEVNDDPE